MNSIKLSMTISSDPRHETRVSFESDTQNISIEGAMYPGDLATVQAVIQAICDRNRYRAKSVVGTDELR